VAASLENLRNGEFPLSRPLTLVTKTEPTGLAKAFINFARSKEVYGIISRQNFVPISE
jgi:phosphate transport system substrate-binding protein